MKGIWTYSALLPTLPEACKVSLGEGHTPLLKSRNIGALLGLDNLYFKLELTNPSGSYKDRFAASAISHLFHEKGEVCLATSSGNTGAALAAYSAAAGIPCLLAVVDGAPQGKLKQMRIYGAHTFTIKGFGKDPATTTAVMDQLAEQAGQFGTSVQISAYHYCPIGMTGVQTIAYELAEALPQRKMQVFVPAGGGGLALAVIRGFEAWASENNRFDKPAVYCVQPEGNDTIATSLRVGAASAVPIPVSQTEISGLQVPNVLDGDGVVAGCRVSGGSGVTVSDQAVFYWQQLMAVKEGIYCEPAAAVALAGVANAVAAGSLDAKNPVVCLVTGHGFKDTGSSDAIAAAVPMSQLNDVSDIPACIKRIISNKV